MIIVQSLTNSFGEAFIAANVIIMRVDGFAMLPNFSFGLAMTTYAGQNVGAGRIDRVSKGLFSATATGIVLSVLTFILMYFFGNQMTLLFIDASETLALEQAFRYNMICTAGFPLLTFILTFRFTIQGMGFSTFAMLAGVLEMIARCFVGIVLPATIGYFSICISSPAAWLTADLFLIPAFFFCRNKLQKQFLPSETATAPSN